MKQHHKVGNRKGLPAYRTPSGFRIRQARRVVELKSVRRKSFLREK